MSIITNGLPSFEKQIQFGRRITFYGLPFLIFVTKKYFTEPEGTKKKPGGVFFFVFVFVSILPSSLFTPRHPSQGHAPHNLYNLSSFFGVPKNYIHMIMTGGKEST